MFKTRKAKARDAAIKEYLQMAKYRAAAFESAAPGESLQMIEERATAARAAAIKESHQMSKDHKTALKEYETTVKDATSRAIWGIIKLCAGMTLIGCLFLPGFNLLAVTCIAIMVLCPKGSYGPEELPPRPPHNPNS